MTWRPPPRLLLCLAAAGTMACGDKVLYIESNAPWSGTVDGLGAVSGVGNQDFDVSEVDGEVCWTLRKTTLAGTLRAYVKDESMFGAGSDIEGLETTSEPYGEIGGCSS